MLIRKDHQHKQAAGHRTSTWHPSVGRFNFELFDLQPCANTTSNLKNSHILGKHVFHVQVQPMAAAAAATDECVVPVPFQELRSGVGIVSSMSKSPESCVLLGKCSKYLLHLRNKTSENLCPRSHSLF